MNARCTPGHTPVVVQDEPGFRAFPHGRLSRYQNVARNATKLARQLAASPTSAVALLSECWARHPGLVCDYLPAVLKDGLGRIVGARFKLRHNGTQILRVKNRKVFNG